MRRLRLPLIAAATIAATAACSGRDPVANEANGEDIPAPMNETSPDALGEAPDNGTRPANGAAPSAAAAIPSALQGRWGLTPGDCTSTRGDNKGLIRIGERTIRFYESTGTLKQRLPGAATSFAGDFAFVGEGMTWERTMTLMLNGDTLSRTEGGQVNTYTRCAA